MISMNFHILLQKYEQFSSLGQYFSFFRHYYSTFSKEKHYFRGAK